MVHILILLQILLFGIKDGLPEESKPSVVCDFVPFPTLSKDGLSKLQDLDDDLKYIKELVRNKKVPNSTMKNKMNREQKTIVKHFSKLSMRNGALVRTIQNSNQMQITQTVVPKCLRDTIMKELHIQMLRSLNVQYA